MAIDHHYHNRPLAQHPNADPAASLQVGANWRSRALLVVIVLLALGLTLPSGDNGSEHQNHGAGVRPRPPSRRLEPATAALAPLLPSHDVPQQQQPGDVLPIKVSLDDDATTTAPSDTPAPARRGDLEAAKLRPDRGPAGETPPPPVPTGVAIIPQQHVGFFSKYRSGRGKSFRLPPEFAMQAAAKAAHIMNDFSTLQLHHFVGSSSGPSAKAAAPEAVCELNHFSTGVCDMDMGKESWLECARRVGPKAMALLLSQRCRETDVWRRLVITDLADAPASEVAFLNSVPRGPVYVAQYAHRDRRPEYVPPGRRSVAKFAVMPRECKSGCRHHPISFGIPAVNLAPKASRHKWWDFVPYVPGPYPSAEDGDSSQGPFTIQDEWLKDQMHRHSYYAFTHKRGGWDCMRHLEILASGAIPYFVDIEQCPQYSIANYPKSLIKEAMAVPGVDHVGEARRDAERINNDFFSKRPGGRVHFKKPGTIAMQRFDREVYFEMADQLLEHAREHMTTAAIVGYILRTIKYEEPKHVLLIGRFTPDFLHLTVEHGLSDLGIDTTVFGHTTSWVLQMVGDAANVTEAALEEHRAAEAGKNGKPLPNHGWFYGFRTSPSVVKHSGVASAQDAAFTARIANGDFDMVIYTYTENNSPIESRPFWEAVRATIPHGRRVFLHGGDDVEDPDRGSLEACQHGTLFKREMRDVEC